MSASTPPTAAFGGRDGAATRTDGDAPMVVGEALGRDFTTGGGVVHALRDVDLVVPRGELMAVRGRSGSGKTTLLSVIGGLDRPTAGRVRVDGREISKLPDSELVEVRRRTIAFI